MLFLPKQLLSKQEQLTYAVCWIFCMAGIWVQVVPSGNVNEGVWGSS